MGVEAIYSRDRAATPAMTDDTLLPSAFPAVAHKKVTAAFDGGRITSDGGVMLLAAADRRLGICAKLAAEIADRRSRPHRPPPAGHPSGSHHGDCLRL
jgi:hypothetical protein